MSDLVAGLAIAVVLEGMLWALFPDFARRMTQDLAGLPARQLSMFAWVMIAAGVILFALARG